MTTPVVVVGGDVNALAIARKFYRRGIPTFVLSSKDNPAAESRCVEQFFSPASGQTIADFFSEVLIESPVPSLAGGVLIMASDEAITFAHQNHDELKEHYLVEENQAALRYELLDKQRTIDIAREANIPAPRYWSIDGATSPGDHSLEGVTFPVLVKPKFTYLYRRVFDRKMTLLDEPSSLNHHLQEVQQAGLDVMVCEFIPGPDDLLCSHYSYRDEHGNSIFDYTKRVERRFPKNFGPACYHVSSVIPEVAEVGTRFFDAIGLRGLGNIEFKRDMRDGLLKLIECNPRVTAAHQLLIDDGMDVVDIIYARLTQGEVPSLQQSAKEQRLIRVGIDYHAYKELRSLGELKTTTWLASLLNPFSAPVFAWADPMPALKLVWSKIARRLKLS